MIQVSIDRQDRSFINNHADDFKVETDKKQGVRSTGFIMKHGIFMAA